MQRGMMPGRFRQAAMEIVGHQIDPIERGANAGKFNVGDELVISKRGGDQIRIIASVLYFGEMIKTLSQRLQQRREVLLVLRPAANSRVGKTGIFPVDVDTVELM